MKKSGKLKIAVTATSMAIISALFLVWIKSDSNTANGAIESKKFNSELSGVYVMTVNVEEVNEKLDVDGRVWAKNRIELFSEVPGTLFAPDNPFEEGTSFQKGELVVDVDSEESDLQLQSSRSAFRSLVSSLMPDLRLDYPDQAHTFENFFELISPRKKLPEFPQIENKQLHHFLSSRQFFEKYYQIKSAEIKHDKFQIRAPFDGILIAAKVEEGYRISPQTHLGSFISNNAFEFKTTLSKSDAAGISPGDTVQFIDRTHNRRWKGIVTRKNVSVDQRSQGIRVYADVSGEGLMDGMYMEGHLEREESKTIASIPRTALLRTGHVYVIQDGVVNMHAVTVQSLNGNMIHVKGLEEGDEIITNPDRPLAGTRLSENKQIDM